MRNFSTIAFFLLCSCVTLVQSQNIFNTWYFGQNAGLDFNGGPPNVISNGQIVSNEGTACISDEMTGRILFYTDGVTMWDSTHTMMSNGDSLSGDVTCTQSALIVKKPYSDSLFYVFTVPAEGGLTNLCYSIVDMSLNGGLGLVTSKNIFIATGVTISEKATAIHRCDGIDWWIIFHDLGSNDYESWLLDSTGLSSTPVVSSVGTVITSDFNRGLGWMTSSTDAKKIVLPSYSGGTIDIVDFDNISGTMSNPIMLTGFTKPYGTTFSPNDNILYVTADMSLIQLDISSGDSATISDSRITITTEGNMMRAMRPGPDGKIYIAREWEVYLGIINNPDVVGTGCNYTSLGVNLSPGSNALGLPNTYSTASSPCPVSITDGEFFSGLKIYPQPASSEINFEISMSDKTLIKLNLIDISGRIIWSEASTFHPGVNQKRFSVEALPVGIYLLQINDGENWVSKRVVKQ